MNKPRRSQQKVEAKTHKDLAEQSFPFHNRREEWDGIGRFHNPKTGANQKAPRVKIQQAGESS